MQNQLHTATTVDRFTIGRCEACGALLAPETSTCASCRGTELTKVPSQGRGVIVTWTVVEVSPTRTCTDMRPFTIAIVALDEGPWTYAWIKGAPDDGAKGMRVRYDRMIPGEAYPLFTIEPDD